MESLSGFPIIFLEIAKCILPLEDWVNTKDVGILYEKNGIKNSTNQTPKSCQNHHSPWVLLLLSHLQSFPLSPMLEHKHYPVTIEKILH